jgi:hypothetical protein
VTHTRSWPLESSGARGSAAFPCKQQDGQDLCRTGTERNRRQDSVAMTKSLTAVFCEVFLQGRKWAMFCGSGGATDQSAAVNRFRSSIGLTSTFANNATRFIAELSPMILKLQRRRNRKRELNMFGRHNRQCVHNNGTQNGFCVRFIHLEIRVRVQGVNRTLLKFKHN